MLNQRILTASRAFSRPAFRSTAPKSRPQRRLASSTPHDPKAIKLEGSADNAFNRERLATKEHAAATADFWRKLSLYVVIPALIIGGANTWVQWCEHWEHQTHEPPPSERKQYPYMNIRNKAYPWGDGDKTLFWNTNYNYNKTGEDE